MSEPRGATYGYEELAARIEQVLGERPSPSALRAARAQGRRTKSTLTKPRLTVGLPASLPAPSRTAPAAFDIEEVERWLAGHPRLAHGLSWRTITSLLVAHDGQVRSIAGVHKRYRHLGPAGR